MVSPVIKDRASLLIAYILGNIIIVVIDGRIMSIANSWECASQSANYVNSTSIPLIQIKEHSCFL